MVVGGLTAWIAPLLFFAAANLWYIPYEERRMINTFGPAYTAYQSEVRRWL